MNRSLTIPAFCSLFAFAALFLAFRGSAAGDKEDVASVSRPALSRCERAESSPAVIAASDPGVTKNAGELLSAAEAEATLNKLTGDYVRPWRQWETSQHQVFTRAAPRPVPPISANVKLDESSSGSSDGYFVATINVKIGENSQPVPCVINRSSRQARFFADGIWLSEGEWIKKAPSPRGPKMGG